MEGEGPIRVEGEILFMHRLWWTSIPLTLLAAAGIVAQTSSSSTGAARAGTLVIDR
jgi:hypothetical protein